MSEAESDADLLHPYVDIKAGGGGGGGDHTHLMPTSGMCYLSPFSICTRGDRTISESNLSSSGYSSMASPGPSRCGSSNPLCPGDMEDPAGGSSGGSRTHLPFYNLRRPNSVLKRCHQQQGGAMTATGESNDAATEHRQRSRSRSDSETLSDDVLLESNDEGIGTDNLDEKIDDAEIRSAKELEMHVIKEHMECDEVLVVTTNKLEVPVAAAAAATTVIGMSQLQLPLIVLQAEGHHDKGVSPVSSRSESPLR